MGSALPALWQRVVDSALPWTLVLGQELPHAFDALSDSDAARRVIQQTLAFWQSYLTPMPARGGPEQGRQIVAAIYGNNPARAVELLGPWVAAHPTRADGFMYYAQSLSQLRRGDEAETAYARAFQLDSTNPAIVNALGQVRMGQRRWATAETLLSRSVELGMENSYTQGQIGLARLQQGRNAEAVISYERAIELGMPSSRATSGVAWYNLACAYARVQRLNDAFRALQRAVEEGMNDRATIAADDDLAPLRADPRFAQLLLRLPA
jgi:Flp pilus assembly protein TadD